MNFITDSRGSILDLCSQTLKMLYCQSVTVANEKYEDQSLKYEMTGQPLTLDQQKCVKQVALGPQSPNVYDYLGFQKPDF